MKGENAFPIQVSVSAHQWMDAISLPKAYGTNAASDASVATCHFLEQRILVVWLCILQNALVVFLLPDDLGINARSSEEPSRHNLSPYVCF